MGTELPKKLCGREFNEQQLEIIFIFFAGGF